jgi:hypothetical protein
MPSWASSETRSRAIISAVKRLASSKSMPGTLRRSSLALARASGPDESSEPTTASTAASSPAIGDDVGQPDLQGPPAVDPLAGQEVLPGPALAHAPHDIGRDGRRDEPDLDLAQPEAGLGRGDDDVAGRDEARAAADGRAVDPGDGRLGQA